MERYKIKSLVFQYLVQNTDLISWFTTNYPSESIVDHLAEHGQRLSIEETLFPTIRYRLVSDLPLDNCDDCGGKVEVLFDIYIESRKDDTTESDELIDLIRSILSIDCQTGIGTFSESTAYSDAVGLNNEVQVWDCKEINNDQVLPEGGNETMTGSMRVTNIETLGRSIFSALRYQMTIA